MFVASGYQSLSELELELELDLFLSLPFVPSGLAGLRRSLDVLFPRLLLESGLLRLLFLLSPSLSELLRLLWVVLPLSLL